MKRFKANNESGIIHDMRFPCWWATRTNPSKLDEYDSLDDAFTDLRSKHFIPHECELCLNKRQKGTLI